MKMADQMEFKISEGLIKPIIQAKIHEAMITAMGGHEKLITDMLDTYMNQVVDNEGKPTNYNGKPRLYHLANRMVEDALKTALIEYLKTKQALLEKEFTKFFESKKGTSQLIAAMQDGFCKALTDKWHFTINVAPPNR
jgi:hypothetical protein